MNGWQKWLGQVLLVSAIFIVSTELAFADNCSSFKDCWNTMLAAVIAVVAATAAAVASLVSKEVWKQVVNDYKNWLRDKLSTYLPHGQAYEEAIDNVRDLADAVRTQGETVFKDIANNVNEGLATGVLPPGRDGGLGQTHDNFTPDGDIPFDVGTIPGIEVGGAGYDRHGGGSGADSAGGSTGDHGGHTPLGGDGSADSPDWGGYPPPTYENLGIDPASGETFIPYSEWGVVDIYNPDGSYKETQAWPPG